MVLAGLLESCFHQRYCAQAARLEGKGRQVMRLGAGYILAAAGPAVALPWSAGTVRVGLGSDPDILDPAIGGSYDGRVVFAALCDKLVDIDASLQFVPQLATEWSWGEDARSLTLKLRQGVVFHDGEAFDAAAVKANIERYKTMPESKRKAELALVSGVEVIDPATVKLQLSRAYAPLVAVLSDRAGMMVSPKAAAAAGPQAGERLVCSGPYRFTERVAQDRIVVDRF